MVIKGDKMWLSLVAESKDSETIALLCWNKDFCFNFKGRRLFHQIVTKAIICFCE